MDDRPQTLELIHRLARRIDELGDRLRRLQDENRSLRQQQGELITERAALLAKNEQARVRVEAMIARLRSLEQHT
ncbi:TIGR02449 family protein [Cognatilysobacter terrigena]|uniref:TIGR02449 family protein n=1 Tax=Cognatilysobacter terrigena TaxID=2488749 RepID=UPI00105CC8E4|nr:TIGR02449 family protein [Lysobacter terrigena]